MNLNLSKTSASLSSQSFCGHYFHVAILLFHTTYISASFTPPIRTLRVAFSFLLSPLFPFVYFIHMTFILSLYWLCVSSDCISCVHVFATIGNERMK